MTNIFIANLDFGITSEDLKATFSQFGDVSYAHVVFDPKTKRSRGFGYVEMENSDEAIAAIEALDGLEVNLRKLDVKIASPKGNRPKVKKIPPKVIYEKSTFTNENATKEYKKEKVSEKKEDKTQPKRVLRPRKRI